MGRNQGRSLGSSVIWLAIPGLTAWAGGCAARGSDVTVTDPLREGMRDEPLASGACLGGLASIALASGRSHHATTLATRAREHHVRAGSRDGVAWMDEVLDAAAAALAAGERSGAGAARNEGEARTWAADVFMLSCSASALDWKDWDVHFERAHRGLRADWLAYPGVKRALAYAGEVARHYGEADRSHDAFALMRSGAAVPGALSSR